MPVNDRADVVTATIPTAQPSAEIDEGGARAVSLATVRKIRRL
jgi:hypothetical protein